MKNGVKVLGDDNEDLQDMDLDALVQAYVNIVTGACISVGKRLSVGCLTQWKENLT